MLRIAALTVFAAILLAAPAAAQDRICRGQFAPKPPQTAAEQELERLRRFAEQRASFGFRHDIPYVRELVRRGVWEYDVGYIPVTPRENVYLRLRDKLDLGAKAERYMRRHRDVDAGGTIVDDWPREPYILVRFTKDVRRHLAALKPLARYPDNLRAERGRYSTRDLERLGDRIWRDRKPLERAGVHLASSGISFEGRLELDVISKRAGAAAYLRKRYHVKAGALKVTVAATEVYSDVCAKSSTYEIAPDGLSLTVRWDTGGGAKPVKVEVTEFSDRVEVGAVERVYNGPRTDDAFTLEHAGALTTPLGERAVIDAASGQRLLQVGPRPGEPPCPAEPEETPLAQAIAERQRRGLPSDPAYVQAQLDRGAFYSKAEERWLGRLETLMDQPKLERYLHRHADDYGGSQLIATYPAAPRIVFRFTRDPGSHLAALRKLTRHPDAVSVEPAAATLAQLEALEHGIETEAESGGRFLDAWGDGGFFITSVLTDESAGVVRVKTVTPRGDAAAYFAARFGPAVRVEVVADRFECVQRYR